MERISHTGTLKASVEGTVEELHAAHQQVHDRFGPDAKCTFGATKDGVPKLTVMVKLPEHRTGNLIQQDREFFIETFMSDMERNQFKMGIGDMPTGVAVGGGEESEEEFQEQDSVPDEDGPGF
jgi:hypothetical protein